MKILPRLTSRGRNIFSGGSRPSRSRSRLQIEQLETRLALSNYIVSPTGNDSAAGTAVAPWKTLQHASDLAKPGDVISVRAGTYAGFIMGWNFPQGGTANAPITFQADPGTLINVRNGKTPDAIDLENCNYVTISGFTIIPDASQSNWRTALRAAGGGIGVNFSNNTIQLRQVDQCGMMTSFTTDLLVQNNTVSGGYDTGIYVANSAVRPTVRGNKVTNVLGNGLLLNGDVSQGGNGLIPGALVENNIITNVGMGGSLAKYGAGSAINLGGVQNSVIRNNIIANAHAKGLTVAQLQSSQGSTNNLIANNTIMVAADGQSALRLADASTGNTIINNVLYSASTNGTDGTLIASAASLAGMKMDYNAVAPRFSADEGSSTLTLSQWQSKYAFDTHSFLLDLTKSFVNASGLDFHLPSTSILIDKGTSQNAPSTDLENKPRPSGNGVDIGAYEFQAGSTSAPAPVGDTVAPKVNSFTPAAAATGVATTASVTALFSEAVQSGTIKFVLKDAAGSVIPSTVTYATNTNTATLKPSAALKASTTYTASVSGVKDLAGNLMVGTTTLSFTTGTVATPPSTSTPPPTSTPPSTSTSYTLWSSSSKPVTASFADANAVELGMKFSSSVAGTITGIRFYKAGTNTGTHVGHLWSSSGQLLASATFTSETASGWQQVTFASPVTIQPNTIYVASYLAPQGSYASDANYFASAYTSGPLSVPPNGSVFRYGSGGGFPTQTWKATNYWVDVVFKPTTPSTL
jgi:parallel beta-helix repeat protein